MSLHLGAVVDVHVGVGLLAEGHRVGQLLLLLLLLLVVGEQEALVPRLCVSDLDNVLCPPGLPTLGHQEAGEDEDDKDWHEGGHQEDDEHKGEEGEDEGERKEEHSDDGPAEGAARPRRLELAVAKEPVEDLEDGARNAAQEELPLLQVAAQEHVGEKNALPVPVLLHGGVVHDQPGPDVEVSEIRAGWNYYISKEENYNKIKRKRQQNLALTYNRHISK